MKKGILIVSLSIMTFSAVAASKSGEYISPSAAVKGCQLANFKPASKPIKTQLKAKASLVAMAYLTHDYQNDIKNPHFCQSMLLMHAQLQGNQSTEVNPYTKYFTEPRYAKATLRVLDAFQLSFDYAIARSNPSVTELKQALAEVDAIKSE